MLARYLELLYPDRRSITGSMAQKEQYDLLADEFPNTTARLRQSICAKAMSMYTALNTRIKTLQACAASERRDKTVAKLYAAKPEIERYSLDLGAKHIKIDTTSNSIHIASLGLYKPFSFRYVNTRPFKRWRAAGAKLSNYIQIRADHSIHVVYTLLKSEPTGHRMIGCDIGSNHLYTMSDARPGPSINSELRRIARRTSLKSRLRAKAQRDNTIGYLINQIDWPSIKQLSVEDLKYLRKRRGFLSHWNYPLILARLAMRCEEYGIKLVKVPARYTSQRCHKCGWVYHNNRDREQFCCTSCGHVGHADLNAAKNIRDGKPGAAIGGAPGASRVGFYWN